MNVGKMFFRLTFHGFLLSFILQAATPEPSNRLSTPQNEHPKFSKGTKRPQPYSQEVAKAFYTKLSNEFVKVRTSAFFVDKTLFLRQWFDSSFDNLYITAPDNFGKSSLVSMMAAFYGASYEVANGTLRESATKKAQDFKLFDQTRIFEEEKYFFTEYFHKYTLLQLDFKPVMKMKDYKSFKRHLCQVITETVKVHAFLLKIKQLDEKWREFLENYSRDDYKYCSDNFESHSLHVGVEILGLLHSVYGKPIIIIIDDFDTLLYAHLLRDDLPKSIETFIQLGMFATSFLKREKPEKQLKNAPRVFKSFLTGTLNFGGIIHGLAHNIFHIDYFTYDWIAKFYGFTRSEVEGLLMKEGIADHISDVETYFSGYSVLNSDLQLFDVASVLMYLTFQETRTYKKDISPADNVLHRFAGAFSTCSIGIKVSECLHKKECHIPILEGVKFTQLERLKQKIEDNLSDPTCGLSYDDVSLFLTLLMEVGFFAVIEKVGTQYKLRPANIDKLHQLESFMAESQFIKNALKITDEVEKSFEETVLNFDGTKKSMNDFGGAIFMLFSKNPPMKKDEFLSFLYGLLRKTSSLHPGIEVESEINVGSRKLDMLLYFKELKTIIFVQGTFEKLGETAVDEILSGQYLNILTESKKYKNYKVEHKILLGISLNRVGTLNMNYLIDTTDVKGSPIYIRKAKSKQGIESARRIEV